MSNISLGLTSLPLLVLMTAGSSTTGSSGGVTTVCLCIGNSVSTSVGNCASPSVGKLVFSFGKSGVGLSGPLFR